MKDSFLFMLVFLTLKYIHYYQYATTLQVIYFTDGIKYIKRNGDVSLFYPFSAK